MINLIITITIIIFLLFITIMVFFIIIIIKIMKLIFFLSYDHSHLLIVVVPRPLSFQSPFLLLFLSFKIVNTVIY